MPMHVLRDNEALPQALNGACLALGNFDGVHRGHQAVLAEAKARAASAGRPCGVMVFEPHPREFFRPHVPVFRLTSLEVKLELFHACGLDFTVVMNFDGELAGMEPDAFIEEVLRERLAISQAIAGFDFHFGKRRKGTPEFLARYGQAHGLQVTIVEPVSGGEGVFSSSAIRRHLEAGEVDAAASLLGYRWFVRGKVVVGDKRGRDLGFPTANIEMPASCRLGFGIYAVRVRRGAGASASVHDAVASYGIRPTFGGGNPVLEVFIFDFAGDLYGEILEVEFVAWLRPELKFDGIEALIARIAEDCDDARAALAGAGGTDSDLDRALGFTPGGAGA